MWTAPFFVFAPACSREPGLAGYCLRGHHLIFGHLVVIVDAEIEMIARNAIT
jgi:hypothetical protein